MRRNESGSILLYIMLVLLVVGLVLLVLFNYRANRTQMETLAAERAAAAVTPTPAPTETPEPTPTPDRTTETVTLAIAGDIVGQAGLSTEARSTESADGDDDPVVSYDYTDLLRNVGTSLDGADFAACTLVGTLEEDGTYDEGYSLDAALATALAGAGFRLVDLATDHILDNGVEGLLRTVNILDGEGLAVSGAHTNGSHAVFMADVQGVDVAVLGYTYGTGGVSVTDDPWCVDILTEDYMTAQQTVDYDRIDADIAAVRAAGADVVVCFVYWWDGNQYYTIPRDNEAEVAEHLLASGVDILIGGGVKTPQPIETRVVERADGSKANCVICYSLSNLLSCFNDRYTNLSATALITVSRDADTGEVWVDGVSYRPLFMLDTDDYEGYDEPGYKYRLLDAYDAIADYEDGGSDISDATYDALLTGVEDLQSILGAEYDTVNGGVTMGFPY